MQSTVANIYFVGFISSLFVKHYDLKNPGNIVAKANNINETSEVLEILQVEPMDDSVASFRIESSPTRQGDEPTTDHHIDSVDIKEPRTLK